MTCRRKIKNDPPRRHGNTEASAKNHESLLKTIQDFFGLMRWESRTPPCFRAFYEAGLVKRVGVKKRVDLFSLLFEAHAKGRKAGCRGPISLVLKRRPLSVAGSMSQGTDRAVAFSGQSEHSIRRPSFLTWLYVTRLPYTFFPLPPRSGTPPAEPGLVKVDRPEGGAPMYSWGGTLTSPGGAYNPATRWEGELLCRRRKPSLFLLTARHRQGRRWRRRFFPRRSIPQHRPQSHQ
jgi:hypothetical protein